MNEQKNIYFIVKYLMLNYMCEYACACNDQNFSYLGLRGPLYLECLVSTTGVGITFRKMFGKAFGGLTISVSITISNLYNL